MFTFCFLPHILVLHTLCRQIQLRCNQDIMSRSNEMPNYSWRDRDDTNRCMDEESGRSAVNSDSQTKDKGCTEDIASKAHATELTEQEQDLSTLASSERISDSRRRVKWDVSTLHSPNSTPTNLRFLQERLETAGINRRTKRPLFQAKTYSYDADMQNAGPASTYVGTHC